MAVSAWVFVVSKASLPVSRKPSSRSHRQRRCPHIFRRLDGFRGYAAWLPLPPSVLVDPGGAQERRRK